MNKIKKAIGLEETKMFFFGAAPLKQSTIKYFASLNILIYNVYGMSETTGAASMHSIDNYKIDTAGTAI